jgi:hypothetical protein
MHSNIDLNTLSTCDFFTILKKTFSKITGNKNTLDQYCEEYIKTKEIHN